MSRRRKVLERGSGEVPEQGSGGSVGFLGAGGNCVPAPRKLFPGAGERSHSFIIEEKCLGSPGAGGSCVPARGKLFPGARESSHSFIIEEKKRFSGAGGSCVPASGKLFPGAGESCVPAPGKLFPGVGERLAGRWLV